MRTRPVLFCDAGCPFAHRVRSLLAHLDVKAEIREAPAHQRPAGLAAWSASERVPFLVHGEVAIGESRVMLEHLAEAFAFAEAWPADLAARTRVRQAMAIADSLLAPALLGAEPPPPARVHELLLALEASGSEVGPGPSLLVFQAAPLWIALRRWRPESALSREIHRLPGLLKWLDAAATLPAVATTAPT